MNDKSFNSSVQNKENRISVENYSEWIEIKKPHILIDVRTEPEVEICSLNASINIPLETIESNGGLDKILKLMEETDKFDGISEMNVQNVKRVVFVCRRGNDSQIARQILERHFDSKNCDKIIICDIIGGLEAWANRIDANFPKY